MGQPGDHLGRAAAAALRPAIPRRIAAIFPQLGKVAIAEVFGGAVGVTVHGMPQIGQLRKGLWVASGFGRQGLNTSAMAGQLIARSILWGDDRWRLFSPFELVWAGGATGRVAGHLIGMWGRGSSAAAGALARYREGARSRNASARRDWRRPTGRPAPEPPRPPPGAAASGAPAAAAARLAAPESCAGTPGCPRRKVRKFGTDPCNFGRAARI